jgi:hypothetical protein
MDVYGTYTVTRVFMGFTNQLITGGPHIGFLVDNQKNGRRHHLGYYKQYDQFGNFRIQYMEVRKRTICLAIFSGDIP